MKQSHQIAIVIGILIVCLLIYVFYLTTSSSKHIQLQEQSQHDQKPCKSHVDHASSNTYSKAAVIELFELTYDIVKDSKLSPPVASRVYALISIALYEAVVLDSCNNQSLAHQ